jgi:hypothetical protein
VLRYLKGMKTTTLHYCKDKNKQLVSYTDSDYTEDITRKSAAKCVFVLASSAIA